MSHQFTVDRLDSRVSPLCALSFFIYHSSITLFHPHAFHLPLQIISINERIVEFALSCGLD